MLINRIRFHGDGPDYQDSWHCNNLTLSRILKLVVTLRLSLPYVET